MLPLDQVTPAEFAACLRQPFTLQSGTELVPLTLVEVNTHPGGTGGRPEPFSLHFQGAAGLRLPQGIYHLEHETMGAMEIFLTQVGAQPHGSFFEAVFN